MKKELKDRWKTRKQQKLRDLQYFGTQGLFQILILAQLLFTQLKKELLFLRETLTTSCMQTTVSAVPQVMPLAFQARQTYGSFTSQEKTPKIKPSAKVLTETCYILFPFHASQRIFVLYNRGLTTNGKILTDLSCRFFLLPLWLSPTLNCLVFTETTTGIFLFYLCSKITQTVSSFVSTQKKSNLPYSIAYYQQHSSSENSLTED